MSRSDPDKQKRRAASRTLLIFGEGLHEESFLKYLHGLYSRNSNVAIKIQRGRGGDAKSIVVDAANIPGSYDRKVVVLDNDKDEAEMTQARQEAKQRRVELLENSPCLEGLLLAILNNGKSYSNKASSWCKKEFESTYLDKKKRTEPVYLAKLFPMTLLDTQRTKIPELDRIIALMKGEF